MNSTIENSLKRKNGGFTLIEILVVLFIMSIVTTVALLSIGKNDNKELERVANEISAIIRLAEEKAMLQANVLNLNVGNDGLHFSNVPTETERRDKNENANLEISDHALALKTFSENVALSIDAPKVMISTNGDITPFTIYVGKQGKKPAYAVSGEADGQISVRPLS